MSWSTAQDGGDYFASHREDTSIEADAAANSGTSDSNDGTNTAAVLPTFALH